MKGGRRNTIAWLEAEQAIRHVLSGCVHWADRADEAMLRSAYHPDGIDEHGSHFIGLGSDFAGYVTMQKPYFAAMSHHLTTTIIEIAGDSAAAQSYMFGILLAVDGQLSWAGGRYLDRLERRDSTWKIAYRRYVSDISLPVAAAGWHEERSSRSVDASRSHADPSYALFRALPDGRVSPEGRRAQMSGHEPGRLLMPDDEVVVNLEAEADIRRVLNRYCHAVDRGDEAMLRSVYHQDGIDEHGSYFVGLGSDFASYVMSEKENFAALMHHLTATMIEVHGDVAAAQTYVIAMHVMSENHQFFWTAGRYLDRFERRDGIWRIAHRKYVHDLDLPVPAVPVNEVAANANTLGERSPADPSYALFRAVAAGRPWPEPRSTQ